MKNVLKYAVIALMPLMAGCWVTQEMKDDVSFKGLTRIYVETPSNVRELVSYYMSDDEINVVVAREINNFLKERGYEPVDKLENAQIIFKPMWNFSLKNPARDNPNYMNPVTNSYIPQNAFTPQYYATLEIQAYFPNREDWVWRGFSPLNMDKKNATEGMVKDQVKWCLEYFPPDKYPSALAQYKQKREKKNAEQENPFAHIKVEKQNVPAAQNTTVPAPQSVEPAVSTPAKSDAAK